MGFCRRRCVIINWRGYLCAFHFPLEAGHGMVIPALVFTACHVIVARHNLTGAQLGELVCLETVVECQLACIAPVLELDYHRLPFPRASLTLARRHRWNGDDSSFDDIIHYSVN